MILSSLRSIALIVLAAVPAWAQQPASPDVRTVTVAGSIDVMNQYMFRGVRQNETGMAVWPAGDLGINLHSGDGALKHVRVNVGFLNSLHTGDTGSQGPTNQSWYESRLSGALELGFAKGVSLETSYAAFISPNDMFTTTKEVAIKVAVDDSSVLGRAALKPYAFLAFEVDAGPGEGQLDGGLKAGKYLELGIAPEYAARRVSVAAPVSLGLSLGDYYELATEDHAFGFVSVGALASVPLRRSSGSGSWNLRGGVQYHVLGETTKAFNGGDRTLVVGSFGIEFVYEIGVAQGFSPGSRS